MIIHNDDDNCNVDSDNNYHAIVMYLAVITAAVVDPVIICCYSIFVIHLLTL
jgi:hypothetical protein